MTEFEKKMAKMSTAQQKKMAKNISELMGMPTKKKKSTAKKKK